MSVAAIGGVGEESFDDLVDGDHVDGGEDEDTCFGGGECDLDGVVVAHFADGDDVGILS